jgi:hypothetical protein
MGPHVFVSPCISDKFNPSNGVEEASVWYSTGVPLLLSIHNGDWFRKAPVVVLWLMLVNSRQIVIISFI